MTVFLILSAEAHFTAVITGVQANVRIEAAFADPNKAENDMAQRQKANPKAVFTLERMEVR
jgi:hypothetical protein